MRHLSKTLQAFHMQVKLQSFSSVHVRAQFAQLVQTQCVLRLSKRPYRTELDTQTVSALLSFILAMVIHPEVQRKVQQQLDDTLGMQRLPTFADREKLPFINWVVWECLRWNPVLPLGLVHLVSEDDEYRGYFIPKGTSILPNVWLAWFVPGLALHLADRIQGNASR